MAYKYSSMRQETFDYLFKLLLIGDSGVGKSSLLLRFTSDTFEDLAPTIAGQERFRTLTSAYYRGAQGIILVYDVTQRDTFTNLSDVWLKELDLYSTYRDCIKMVVGNKVDKVQERVVSKQEGIQFAREHGCIYLECSAKNCINVENCFEELALKILDTPSLLVDNVALKRSNIFIQEQPTDGWTFSCC
ncbi:ras-related protein RABC1 isoform X2 [Cryptomeria japonica]|uniref:ras-related protein RABC1 isoform X2 n=1 Tax=Cryptomeria japonica TaxID=3369 RepID=UPI0027DA74E4|nr:ras-related protein RABC1 isoform X2 [Cryptomeria japonica]